MSAISQSRKWDELIVDALGISTSGMQAALDWQTITANNIANANTENFQSQQPVDQEAPGNGVKTAKLMTSGPEDLVGDVVGQMLSSAAFKANIVSARTAQAIYKDLLKLGSSKG